MSEEINHDRRRFLHTAAMSIAAASVGMFGLPVQHVTPGEFQLPIEGELPSLASATGWLNSQPLTAGGLQRKVVLIDFWTYTCINWLRTLPYVRAWAEKYREHDVVVIGVHTPGLPFEHGLENVRRAASDLRSSYPIAIDNDHPIWLALDN